MNILDFITMMNPDVLPENSKLHLASRDNENKNPYDEYISGRFNEWQRWQTRRNFEREYVISMISLTEADQWLFAGVFSSSSPERRFYPDTPYELYYYNLTEDPSSTELSGRLVLNFKRPSRQSYLMTEKWYKQITLAEIYPKPLTIGEFPGFRNIDLSFDNLKIIIDNSLDSWRSALSNISGIYLISDSRSCGLYVGAAYGGGGIWQRWSDYASSGHGGNEEMKKLMEKNGDEYTRFFRYSILETADLYSSEHDIRQREAYWKEILLSKTCGLNQN